MMHSVRASIRIDSVDKALFVHISDAGIRQIRARSPLFHIPRFGMKSSLSKKDAHAGKFRRPDLERATFDGFFLYVQAPMLSEIPLFYAFSQMKIKQVFRYFQQMKWHLSNCEKTVI